MGDIGSRHVHRHGGALELGMKKAETVRGGATIVVDGKTHKVRAVTPVAPCKRYGLPKTHILVGDGQGTEWCVDSTHEFEVK